MKNRKICVVITARPSYSRIKTALLAIEKHPNLELQLVLAASSLLDRYGSVIKYVEEDNFPIAAKIFNVLEGENLLVQAKTTGLGIIEIASVLTQLSPDAVVTIADRYETMATAIAASYLNIPLVHIQGGEVTGNIDEKVRHAITKLSDLHFVSTKKAQERLIRMGENPNKVFHTGCPSIDLANEIYLNYTLDFDIYDKYGGVGMHPDIDDGYIVVMQHPVTTEYNLSRIHIEETLEAVRSINLPVLWFWPNVDAGSDGTSKGIRIFREKNDSKFIHFFKNMQSQDFLKVLKNCKCLVGNSSVGIRECSYLGIPVVNIGSRQLGRERGKNVIDVGYAHEDIKTSILFQCQVGHYTPERIYGDGSAGEKIANLLHTQDLTYQKKLNY